MGNHIWTLGSKQIPRKCDCQAKDVSEKEEEEEEAPHNLHCTIPWPNGEAGRGGDSGRGFNIQNLIGLSEDKAWYNAITVSLCPSMIHFPDLILGSCSEHYAHSLQAQRSTSLAFTGPRYISDNACYWSGLSIMLLMNWLTQNSLGRERVPWTYSVQGFLAHKRTH